MVLNDPNWLADNDVALALAGPGIVATDVVVADEALPVTQRAVPPFSRFTVRIMSRSPRGLTNNAWVPSAQPGYTRPELFCEPAPSLYRSTCFTRTWGSGSDKGTEYALDLFVSRAGFQRASDSPAWNIQYQSALTTPTASGWQDLPAISTASIQVMTPMSSSAYDSYAMRITARYKFLDFTDGRRMYFRVRVSGYNARRAPAGAVPVMVTNAAGPSGVGNATGVTTFLARDWGF